MTQTRRSHMDVLLRRSLPAVAVAIGVCALAGSLFAVDATEYGVVTRFGRIVRVVVQPGLYVTARFDRIVRLDKRLLFFRPERSEYLTADKKNIVVESLAAWRIADPARFLVTCTGPGTAERVLGDVVVGQIGAVIGQYPASALVSTDPAEGRYRPIVSEIERRVAEFARSAYGIEVISLDVGRLSLPEQNRTHVFDRMTAERAKIAKENRSAGELQARKITAEADHERVHIEAEAAGASARIRAEGDAEATRTYAAAFGQDPRFYEFLRTLQAYDKVLDEKTTLFFPADAEILRLLRFDARPAPAEPSPTTPTPVGAAGSPQGPNSHSADADRVVKKKSTEEFR